MRPCQEACKPQPYEAAARSQLERGGLFRYTVLLVRQGTEQSMGEIIRREAAAAPLTFSGERLTAAISGQVEIEHYHRYLLAREFCRGKDVLDVAAGEGYGTALLAQVARSAVGIEIDADTVAAARKEFQRPNLRFEQGDARALSLPDASVDVVASFETLEHLAEQDLFLSEIRRVLRPGGLLIISTPDRDAYSPIGTPPNPYHVLELTRAEFEGLLLRHFSHAALSAQRALIGSVILGSGQDASARTYERRSDAFIEGCDHLPRAPYLVALASDSTLPPLPNSVYVYRSDLDTDPQTRREAELSLRAAEGRISDVEQQLAAAARRADEARERERYAAEVIAELQPAAAQGQRALQLEQRLRAMEASTIWRATRPLRAVGTRFPFLARNLGRGAKLAWWTVTLQLPRRYAMWQASRRPSAIPERAQVRPAKDIQVPLSSDPVVSIIISTYGQADVTLACLQSIADHPPRHPIEVLLVDDAYPDAQSVNVLREVGGIRFSRNAQNLGFLRSCNQAAQIAKGRYIHFLNNDTELQPDAVDALVDLLEARPDAGMAGSKLLFPDGQLQEAGGILWSDASGWNYGRSDDPARPEYNYLREVDYCSGASIMVRRALFESLGGFDEVFVPAYYEDADLAFRIRDVGLKVLYEPRSVVVHHEGMSHGTDLTSGVKAHQLVNQARMVERWGAVLERENYSNAQHVLRARDRARTRKLILVIDHYVPEPDRDAGSRSTLGILDSLVDAGWATKFWPANRIYSPIYTPQLEQRGIEVLDRRWPGDLGAWLQQNGSDLDHLLIIRPTVAADVLPHVMHTDAVLSFYGVDLHFARMQRQAALEGNPTLLAQAAAMERLERRVWRHFDVVIYPSEEEAAQVRSMSPPTTARGIVPFCFDVSSESLVLPRGRSLLFVAGFAHPPNVDAAKFLVQEILPLLVQEIGPVDVTLAGSNPTEAVKALGGPNVTVTGYLSDDALAELYRSHRVAIVPLRFGAGVKGKVVEALSRGLPLVTTSTGSQGIAGLDDVVPVRDDIPGLVAALKLLLTDDPAWTAQSAAQLEFARRCFSREAMRRSVLSALEAGEAAVQRTAAPLSADHSH